MPKKGAKRQHDSMDNNELVGGPKDKKPKVLKGGKQLLNVISNNGNKLHPFEVDNVVEIVTSKLENPDLMKCRQLSKLFCLHATTQLAKRETSPVIFNNSIASGRFKKLMQNNQELEKGYTLLGNFVIKNRIPNRMIAQFSVFGSMVQHLITDVDESLATSSDPSIINFDSMFNILQHTPNVESLTLNNLNFSAIKSVAGPELPFLSTLIIKIDFSRFQIDTIDKYCIHCANVSKTRFQEISRKLSSAVPNLKKLELYLSYPDVFSYSYQNWTANKWRMLAAYLNESSYLFQDLGVHKLDHLVIKVAHAYPNNLENLLSFQASTLKTLDFSVPTIILNPVVSLHSETFQQTSYFPVMEKLESLSLLSSCSRGPYAIGMIRHDVDLFPKLQSLAISDEILGCFPVSGVYGAVQQLNIRYDSLDHKRNELASRVDLFNLFPNIRKLTIELVGGSSAFKILTILFSSTKRNSSKVRELVINCKEGHFGYSTSIFTGLNQPPKLLGFTRLEILDIAFNESEHIDDSISFNLFYGMSPLKKLTITNANISPDRQDYLKTIHGEVIFQEEQYYF